MIMICLFQFFWTLQSGYDGELCSQCGYGLHQWPHSPPPRSWLKAVQILCSSFSFPRFTIVFPSHLLIYWHVCFMNLNNCLPYFSPQDVFPSFFLCWSFLVSLSSPSLLPITSKVWWRRWKHNVQGSHTRSVQNTHKIFNQCGGYSAWSCNMTEMYYHTPSWW